MQVLMIQSKIKPEGLADVQAAVHKMLAALEAARPEGLRYAALMQPDDETIVALRQLADPEANPLEDLPGYKELLDPALAGRAASRRSVDRQRLIPVVLRVGAKFTGGSALRCHSRGCRLVFWGVGNTSVRRSQS